MQDSGTHKCVLLQIQVFWYVTPCRFGNIYPCFETSFCLHLQGQVVKKEQPQQKI